MTPFETLIKDFAEKTGLPLQVEADNSCSLETDDMIFTMQYRQENDDVIIFAPVMTGEDNEKLPYGVLKKALELSYNGRGTRNAFLGMFDGALVLSITLPMNNLDADSLGIHILTFAETAQGIALELKNILVEEGGFEPQNKKESPDNAASTQEIFHA